MAQEELLDGRVTILLAFQVDAFPLRIFQERDVGQAQAAVVGRVLAQRQLAVYLYIVDRDKVAVLLYFAVGFLFEVFAIFRGPPVGQISIGIELAAFIVEAMSEFMSNDAANVAVV